MFTVFTTVSSTYRESVHFRGFNIQEMHLILSMDMVDLIDKILVLLC